MLKNLLKCIMCSIVLAVFVSFAATEVMAEVCESPDCITADDCQIKIIRGADGKYPIVITESNAGQYPQQYVLACSGSFPCTVFAYELSSCTISQFAQALPDPAYYCSENQWDILFKSIPATWQPAGAGDSDSKWYAGDNTVRVLEMQPSVTEFFYITTNNVSAHPTPLFIKHGKKGEYYRTILAPNCEVPPPPQPELQLTTSGFSVVDPDTGIEYHVLVTLDQYGKLSDVQFCDEKWQDCADAGEGRPQEEMYHCKPKKDTADNTCPDDSSLRELYNPIDKEDQDYCCFSITASDEDRATSWKGGEDSSCPMLIGGRWYDFCGGCDCVCGNGYPNCAYCPSPPFNCTSPN